MAERRGKRDDTRVPTATSEPAAAPEDTAAEDHPAPANNRVDIGPVSIHAPAEWQFYPLEDRVVGRHASKVGVLQIKVLPTSAVPAGASHEMFMGLARDMSGYELEGTGSDPAKERIGCCMAGGESFRSGNDFVRVWYHHRPEGVAVASFSLKASRIAERSVAKLIRECDKIIASLRLPEPADA